MRRINDAGLAIVKRFEGLELTAYFCPAKILTIGYGSTGPHVKPGMTITPAEAERLLLEDLSRFERGVEAITAGFPTNDNQFSALVSFAFNLGLTALLRSTLMRRHKAGDYAGAAQQFGSWNKIRKNGQLVPLAGLTARREAERKLYVA